MGRGKAGKTVDCDLFDEDSLREELQEKTAGVDAGILQEAIGICRESPLYHTLSKAWRREAIMHTYCILISASGEETNILS